MMAHSIVVAMCSLVAVAQPGGEADRCVLDSAGKPILNAAPLYYYAPFCLPEADYCPVGFGASSWWTDEWYQRYKSRLSFLAEEYRWAPDLIYAAARIDVCDWDLPAGTPGVWQKWIPSLCALVVADVLRQVDSAEPESFRTAMGDLMALRVLAQRLFARGFTWRAAQCELFVASAVRIAVARHRPDDRDAAWLSEQLETVICTPAALVPLYRRWYQTWLRRDVAQWKYLWPPGFDAGGDGLSESDRHRLIAEVDAINRPLLPGFLAAVQCLQSEAEAKSLIDSMIERFAPDYSEGGGGTARCVWPVLTDGPSFETAVLPVIRAGKAMREVRAELAEIADRGQSGDQGPAGVLP